MNASSKVAEAGPSRSGATTPLLAIDGLTVEFRAGGAWTPVLRNVSFEIGSDEIVGLVGESGSGKTMTALTTLRLLPRTGVRVSGSIRYQGREMLGLRERELNEIRGNEIAMIFQEPMTSMNPAFTVGEQIAETVRAHRGASRKAAMQTAIQYLDRVGIADAGRRATDYPYQFSGGMRQRAMIAMALACGPKLLIADEATTALDVTIQAMILGLLKDLQEEFSMSVVLITHDLGVASQLCERIVVMYSGQIVEVGEVAEVFAAPRHPYTSALLSTIPSLDHRPRERFVSILGSVPAPSALPSGCTYHPRCAHAVDSRCTTEPIPLFDGDAGRQVRCVRADEIELGGI